MRYRKKLGILLLIFIMVVTSYAKHEFKASILEINLSKNTALANGEDQIIIDYRITDDNGVPLRNIDKKKLKLMIDGKESNEFILISNEAKDMEITLSYENLETSKKITFIEDTRSLNIFLSKNRVLADGKDEIIIGVENENGEDWNDTVSLYINDNEVTTNVFKTKEVGEYKILAKSGDFRSQTKKVIAYEEIDNLTLKANKTKLLANKKDSILFTLSGIDQNNNPREIENFILVDDRGQEISTSNILMTEKSGIYKIKALYKGKYSNSITIRSNYPNELDVVSVYPIKTTLNLDTKIEVQLNVDLENYEDAIKVFENGKVIDGKISYDKDRTTIIFTPTTPLELGKTYKVILKKSIVGIHENKLKDNHIFEFAVVEKIVPEMVKVESGNFILGDKTGKLWKFASPTQEATITYDYFIGKTPVTFEMYDQYTREMRLPHVDDNGWGRKTRPVINVTWEDAVSYLNWLSKKEGLPVAYDKNGNLIDSDGNSTRDITKVLGYRLPTEIEWEYAGRGGNKSKETLFSGSNKVGDVAWYSENSKGKTHEVETKMPNELGIYDMSGNVWEWINDNSGVYSGIERINSVGPKKKGLKILRGGSFNSIMSDTELAFRDELSPNTKDIYYGFRIARTIIKEEK